MFFLRQFRKISVVEGLTFSAHYVQAKEEEVLFAYIFMASHAISLVLIRVDNGVQRPVYCVGKLLHEAEIRYLPLEKTILVVVHATRKLSHYFQA